MWIDSKIYEEDLNNIINAQTIDWNKFQNKKFFITGATGLIGTTLVNTLLYANMKKHLNCTIYAMVRNQNKALTLYQKQLEQNIGLHVLTGDILAPVLFDTGKIDYIIHAASQTSSILFVEKPVETINTTFYGTHNILEYAKAHDAESVIFLSTMEVYGAPQNDDPIPESHGTDLQTTTVRSSYPISKIMAENLCVSYAKEYGLNVKIARLTQTFGPGVSIHDNRIFADFARCALAKKNICLHTKGDTKRSYLYTADAVSAILHILLYGQNMEAYNVANENTYCSILDMAKLVARKNNIDIIYDFAKYPSSCGYAPTLHMNLDTTKLKQLGWKANYDLEHMYDRLINTMQSC